MVLDKDLLRKFCADILDLVRVYCLKTKANPSDVLEEMMSRLCLVCIKENRCLAFWIVSYNDNEVTIHRVCIKEPSQTLTWLDEISNMFGDRELITELPPDAPKGLLRLMNLRGFSLRGLVFKKEQHHV